MLLGREDEVPSSTVSNGSGPSIALYLLEHSSAFETLLYADS